MPASQQEAQAIREAIDAASVAANPDQIATEVMVLLSAFYVDHSPEALRNRMAEIWLIHLRPFPLWALKAAAEWWLGPDNTKRRSKPMPGDIAHRCQVETLPLRQAELALTRWRKYRGNYPEFMRRD